MNCNSRKPLVIAEVKFRSSPDNAARLKRVFNLLLALNQHCEETDARLHDKQLQKEEETDVSQQQ